MILILSNFALKNICKHVLINIFIETGYIFFIEGSSDELE